MTLDPFFQKNDIELPEGSEQEKPKNESAPKGKVKINSEGEIAPDPLSYAISLPGNIVRRRTNLFIGLFVSFAVLTIGLASIVGTHITITNVQVMPTWTPEVRPTPQPTDDPTWVNGLSDSPYSI